MKFLYKPNFTIADLLVVYAGSLIDRYITHNLLFLILFVAVGFIFTTNKQNKNYHEALPRNTNNG
jgi:F0F1-type ATP synthase assembly protein I